MLRLLLGLEIIEHLSHLADNALECVWVTCLNNYRETVELIVMPENEKKDYER